MITPSGIPPRLVPNKRDTQPRVLNSNLGQQWQQLAMFHTPRELQDSNNFRHVDRGAYSSDAQMWRAKLQEAQVPGGIARPHGSGVYDSIAKEGFKGTLPLSHDEPTRLSLADGHHRVAAAAAINPDMLIPVEHYSSAGAYWQKFYGERGD